MSDAGKAQVSEFLRERLQFYLKDVRGFAYDVVNAVLAAGADDVRDAIARAEALTAVRGSEDFAAISAAFKRIKNILRQAEEKGYQPDAAEAGRHWRWRRSTCGTGQRSLRRRSPSCASSAPMARRWR